mmetsp:Transcript_34257/g.38994  ORF Transcript_34257/g.38994 Transcript_34257/m.38994 type:complete len:216 (-) Transcript_34257:62-709(-)
MLQAALKKRIEEENMIAKLGSKEKWEEEKQKIAKRQKSAQIKKALCTEWNKIVQVSNGSIADSIDGIQLTKTAAKQEWLLRDEDITKLSSSKSGRSIKYELKDVIEAAIKRHNKDKVDNLQGKLASKDKQRSQYARYFKNKLDEKLNKQPADILDEVSEEMKSKLENAVDDSRVQLQKASQKLEMFNSLLGKHPFSGIDKKEYNIIPNNNKKPKR